MSEMVQPKSKTPAKDVLGSGFWSLLGLGHILTNPLRMAVGKRPRWLPVLAGSFVQLLHLQTGVSDRVLGTNGVSGRSMELPFAQTVGFRFMFHGLEGDLPFAEDSFNRFSSFEEKPS